MEKLQVGDGLQVCAQSTSTSSMSAAICTALVAGQANDKDCTITTYMFQIYATQRSTPQAGSQFAAGEHPCRTSHVQNWMHTDVVCAEPQQYMSTAWSCMCQLLLIAVALHVFGLLPIGPGCQPDCGAA